MERPPTAHLSKSTARKEDEGNTSEFSVESRPASRRGTRTAQQQRETSVRGERTLSRGLSTASQEINWRPGSGVARIQGTASRLVSAATQHKGSSMILNTPRLDTSQVNITDRLLTQQGLSSSRARSSGSGLRGPGKRQVLDKRYYEGLLQLKIQELSNEISSLRKETEQSNKEREDFMIYDKQNKERAKELTELQGILADYNLVMDKLHTGTDMKDIDAECQALRIANDAEQSKLELVFRERTQKQQQIHQLEEEIKKERHVAEKLMETMSPEMKEKYLELSNKNTTLQKTIDAIQQELDTLSRDKALLEQQIANAPLKQEAVKLELKLLELEEKRENLLAEENDNDPNNLQQKYLNQVKGDNVEIATMERSMNQLNDELKNYEKQLEQVEQDLEECQSERHKKYVEYRKRDETIESFLSTYEDTKQKEKENATKLRNDIVRTLSAISEHLVSLPATENEYQLVHKELARIDSADSNEQKSLYVQYKQKELYLEKLEILEGKLQAEIGSLHDRIEKIQSEIAIYENLDALKDEAEQKRVELLEKKNIYLEVQDKLKDELKIVRQKYEEIKKELQANETHKQLQALERKLAQIEQDNFALREFISDKKFEMNYESSKKQTIQLVHAYNDDLKERHKGGI